MGGAIFALFVLPLIIIIISLFVYKISDDKVKEEEI